MPTKLNIPIGTRYGRLTIEAEIERDNFNKRCFRCKCDCGNTAIIQLEKMRIGNTRSCGCLMREILTKLHKTHGQSGTFFYGVWKNMMRRCYNRTHKQYYLWGGRGISVCEGWHNVLCFIEWCKGGAYEPGKQIDRKDNDGDYEPNNCRWATRKIQNNNRRTCKYITFQNKTLSLTQWADCLGICMNTLKCRIKRGWPIERALTAPKGSKR